MYEADRAEVALNLIILPKLRQLIVDFYDKLDAETRALVPRRRFYWPVANSSARGARVPNLPKRSHPVASAWTAYVSSVAPVLPTSVPEWL